MEFFAACGYGFERELGNELRAAKVRGVRPLGGGVAFGGDVADAYKALLWSRIASRVLLTLDRVSAKDADALYEGVKALPWEDHIAPGATIAVDARGTNTSLHDTRFTALRVKDAVCDRLRDLRGERPNVDSARPDVRINVVVSHGKATVSIDLSGASLDKRGYRPKGRAAGAPLRENLAAGLLAAAGWPERCTQGAGLLNAWCGPGIIAVEAAMMAAQVAPGLRRSSWGFDGWSGHDPQVWDALIDEADARAEAGLETTPFIIAADDDPNALEYARTCAKRAGVERLITFMDMAAAPCLDSLGAAPGGIAVCNLNGLSQLESLAQAPAFFAKLRARVLEDEGIDRLALLTSPEAPAALTGLKPEDEREVRNGPDEALLSIFDLSTAPDLIELEIGEERVQVSDEGVRQFVDRLTKTAKQRAKWAASNGISAYRVYDADLPDYNLAIDLYQGAGPDTGRTLVNVAEYSAPKKIDPAKTARRLNDALAVMPAVLGVAAEDIYVKRRTRAKGGSQYAQGAAIDDTRRRFITQEGGLLFEVDLGDRLDTGLFLDHRDTRALLRKLATGKSFLNLFAYTGSASVYAAAGKAEFTTTVDMSNTYLDWARRNMEVNGLLDEHQEFIRADALSWVSQQRRTRNRWDLIFVDPPTFSNSTKMGGRTWDVQKDHAELLIGCSRLLRRGGAVLFSCNLRKFELDAEKLAKAGVEAVDITDKTIPEDFARHKGVHHCFLLRRTAKPVE